MEQLIGKAEVLIEALPYIRRFYDTTMNELQLLKLPTPTMIPTWTPQPTASPTLEPTLEVTPTVPLY